VKRKQRTVRAAREDIVEKMIRQFAQEAIEEEKIWEYYCFWSKEPIGWQKKAKGILREELQKRRVKQCG